MSKLIFMTVSFLLVMLISIFAAILPINGQTTGNISESYTILAFPSKYVFYAIIPIYISILYWFYQQWQIVRKHEVTISTIQSILFSLSMLLQLVSLYYWHQQDFVTSSVILIISTLAFVLFYFFLQPENTWSNRLPITFYLAWLVLLIMLNIATIFVDFHWTAFGLSEQLWIVVLMTVIMATALHIRFHHYDPYFPILFIWFFIGIAIENNFEELLISTAALFLSGVLLAGIIFMVKKKPSGVLINPK